MKRPLCILLLCLLACGAQAHAFSRLYVFGDSLSDVGNVYNSEPLNDGGRFSNGPVWNELLAQKLGVATPTASGDTTASGATNFAYGGGMTSWGTTSIVPGVISLEEQIVGGRNARREIDRPELGFDRYGVDFDKDDLVCVWGGANNFFFGAQIIFTHDIVAQAERAAGDIITNLGLLADRGAATIVLLNLPDIGRTSEYLAKTLEKQAEATLYSDRFNAKLAELLPGFLTDHTEVNLITVDMYALFDQMLDAPSVFGFSNVTDNLVALENAGTPAEDPSQYVFYDGVHPTTAAHEIIAQAVMAAIPESSACTLLAGLLALGMAVRRRR